MYGYDCVGGKEIVIRPIGFLLLIMLCAPGFGADTTPATDALDELSKQFSKSAFIVDVKISPSGKYFFVSADSDGDQTATIFETKTNQPVRVLEFDRDWQIGSIVWASDSELAISPRVTPVLRNYSVVTGDLAIFSIEGKYKKIIYGPNAKGTNLGAKAGRIRSKGGAIVLDTLPEKKRTLLIQIFEASRTGFGEIDIRSGRIRGLTYGPKQRCSFATDAKGNVRYCSAVDPLTVKTEIYELVGKDWQLIHSTAAGERLQILDTDSRTGLIYALKETPASTLGLYQYLTESKEFVEIFQPQRFDVYEILGDRKSGYYAIYLRNPFYNYSYEIGDNPLSSLHAKLSQSFPGRSVTITSTTDEKELAIVFVSAPSFPGSFYFFDTKNNSLRFLGKRYPWIEEDLLSDMEPFYFETSDGLRVDGFFTRARNGRRIGSVVLAHGGPHGPLDHYGYHREVQYFASIGLDVIQVNFRGSGGFGRVFEEAGHREWSGKMIDDIVEGATFAVEDLGAHENLCIYGASYGAFAAASAAFRYPDFFRCAAGHVGVYDLPEMFESGDIPQTKGGLVFLRAVLGEDKESLIAASPSRNVDRIKIPMHLTAGDDDYRAPPIQTKIMDRELRAAGKKVETIYIDREGHGFASNQNEMKRLKALGQFLVSNLDF